MMPGTSGDAYAAPGRAMQGLGNAIASLGAAFDAKADQENDYNDKMRMYQFDNKVDLEARKRQETYNGDGTGYTAETQGWYESKKPELLEGMSPKGRRQAELYFERKRGTVQEGAYTFETRRRHEGMFVAAETAITSEFGKLVDLPPDQFEAGSAVTLKGINEIINQHPGGEPVKERLRTHAQQLYEAAILKVLPEGSRAQAAKRLMEQWQKTLPTEPVPAPGPQSNLNEVDRTSVGLRNLGGIKPQGIVFHHTSGTTVDGAISTLQKRGLSYNYLIDRDGTVHTVVPPDKGAQHMRPAQNGSGLASNNSIGISFVARNDGDVNEKQRAAGRALAARDAQKFGIPQTHVYGHGEVNSHKEHNEGSTDAAWIRKNGFGGGPPQADARAGGITPTATAYSPQRGGDRMEGGYAAAKPGPDGKAEVRTLADVSAGRSQYVTLAGDPSQYGKTFIIPEITYKDASGKEVTLKNVKGVVHDTGSAFKGKGDQRFDIPVDRDLPSASLGSQPFSKKKVAFVPEGADQGKGGPVRVASLGGGVPQPENEPEPSKVTETLKGTPEEKAAKLRELMAKGYQDVVHQLDNDGNDVIIAKKSQKPVWQRGVRGKNEDGTIPNELDRPDFAGPGWANGVVEDVKAGKLRPTNTIPGETKVAEAPTTPATRYRPSVETKLMESLQKKMGALKAQDEAAVGNMVKLAEDNAGKGAFLPEKERNALEAAILATGSKELADRYTRANLAAAETYMLQAARPDRIRDVAIGMRAEIARAGGEATPEQLAKAEAVEKLAKHVDTELDTDMLGWGQKIGVIPHLPALDPARPDPESLKAYAEAATYMGARYGRQPQVFSKMQAEAVAERFKMGGPQMLDMLGRYATGLGPPLMAQAMKQIAPHAPEGAIAGYLYGNNINQAAAKDIAETLHRRKDPNYKAPPFDRGAFEDTAEAVLSDALRTYPQEQRDAILRATEAIYENRVRGKAANTPDQGAYDQALRDVIGERLHKGYRYGGVASLQSKKEGNWFSTKNSVVIPPAWRQDTVKTTLETVSADELKAAGLPLPMTKKGTPVRMLDVANRGTLVPIGDGLGTYAVAMGDPKVPGQENFLMAMPANPREDRQTLPNQPFIIDFNKLEPTVRKRLPSAFWAD